MTEQASSLSLAGVAVRRLLAIVPVVLGVSVAVFLMIHLIPGDPAQLIAGVDASPSDVENVRQHLGLDQPLLTQYASYVERIAAGDFGTSYRSGRPVVDEIAEKYPNTLLLGGAALAIAVLVGGVTGIVSAVRKYTWLDNLCLLLSLLGVSMPTFFFGLLAMIVFSVWLGWLPLSGNDTWAHVILPAVTLGLPSAAVISRIIRSILVEVMEQAYIRTARAKGLREIWVVSNHALRNAMIPVVTVVGLQLGYLLGGAVVTETVFAWPGLGRLMVQAISARDFPVVQASILVLALTFVLVNLLTDLLYLILDPRITQP